MATSIINTSRIAIVGLGQLGCSLGLRLREIGAVSVYGVARREVAIIQAKAAGAIDAGSTHAEEIIPVVDITFICLPLTASIDFVRENLAHFRVGSLVTDVGSVKAPLVQALRPLLLERGVYFIGGHPMAGSEKSGQEVARKDLYENAVVFLTPTPDDEPEAITLLANFWRDIGSAPLELDAARHDRAVAHSSHLPHLLAAALATTVLSQGDAEAQAVSAAGSFRDMSRVAASNVPMWLEIFRLNQPALLAALDEYEAELARLRALIVAGDTGALATALTAAKDARERWYADHGRARGYQT